MRIADKTAFFLLGEMVEYNHTDIILIILKVKKQGIILTEDLVDFLLLNNGYRFIMKTEQKQR